MGENDHPISVEFAVLVRFDAKPFPDIEHASHALRKSGQPGPASRRRAISDHELDGALSPVAPAEVPAFQSA
jgi:hypothetical protein